MRGQLFDAGIGDGVDHRLAALNQPIALFKITDRIGHTDRDPDQKHHKNRQFDTDRHILQHLERGVEKAHGGTTPAL